MEQAAPVDQQVVQLQSAIKTQAPKKNYQKDQHEQHEHATNRLGANLKFKQVSLQQMNN